MTLDVLAVVIALLLTGFGYFTGALTQVTRMIGLILTFIAAPVLARVYKEIIFADAWPGGATLEWGMLLLAGASIYGGVSILGFLITRLVHTASDEMTETDKNAGAVIGFVKSLGVVYLLVSSMLLIQAPLERADPEDQLHLRDSVLLALVEHNPIAIDWSMPDLAHLLDLLAVPREHLEKELAADPAGRRLLDDRTFQRLLSDPGAVKAAQEGDVSELIEHPDVRKLLADGALREQLRSAP
ncbi:MAG: CvpA family protein [Myxococcota bacterium]